MKTKTIVWGLVGIAGVIIIWKWVKSSQTATASTATAPTGTTPVTSTGTTASTTSTDTTSSAASTGVITTPTVSTAVAGTTYNTLGVSWSGTKEKAVILTDLATGALFSVDDTVKILTGPYMGWTAPITTIDNSNPIPGTSQNVSALYLNIPFYQSQQDQSQPGTFTKI